MQKVLAALTSPNVRVLEALSLDGLR